MGAGACCWVCVAALTASSLLVSSTNAHAQAARNTTATTARTAIGRFQLGVAAMAALVAGVCLEGGIPFAGILEGGYDLDALSRSVCEVLDVWGRGVTAAPGSVAVHGLALRAQERLAKSGAWPQLGQQTV